MFHFRSMKNRWSLAWVLVLVASLFCVPSTFADASVSVDTSVVETGGTLVIRASGFRNNEAIVTWASSARGTVYATKAGSADSKGNVTIRIDVKRFWEPGYWAITVHGLRSNRRAVAPFEVKTGLPDGTLELAATTLKPGTKLMARGVGFTNRELVSAWITRPDGTTDRVPASPLRPAGGVIQLSYDVPYGAQLGVWAVTAYGNDSDLILISHFTVEE